MPARQIADLEHALVILPVDRHLEPVFVFQLVRRHHDGQCFHRIAGPIGRRRIAQHFAVQIHRHARAVRAIGV